MCQLIRSINLYHLQYQEYRLFLSHRNFIFNLTFVICLGFFSWLIRLDQAHRGCTFPLNFTLVYLCSQRFTFPLTYSLDYLCSHRLYVPPEFFIRLTYHLIRPDFWFESQILYVPPGFFQYLTRLVDSPNLPGQPQGDPYGLSLENDCRCFQI